MFKRFLFYCLVLAIMTVSTIHIFHAYETDTMEVPTDSIKYSIYPSYSGDTIDTYISQQTDQVNILFYNAQDSTSIYLFNNLLTQILQENGVSQLENLIYCEVPTAGTQDYRNHWGFHDVPSFVAIHYHDGFAEAVSVLEWPSSRNLTTVDITEWFETNGVVYKPVSEETDTETTPAS